MKCTDKLHPSKKTLGYYYTKFNNLFIAYSGNVKLQEYKTELECIESFKNRQ